MVDSNYKTNDKNARQAIAPIVDTVKLHKRQNNLLRCRSNISKNQPELGENGLTKTGNLIELLNYQIPSGNETLENYPRFAQQNVKYISPEIPHDQILCWLHYLELII